MLRGYYRDANNPLHLCSVKKARLKCDFQPGVLKLWRLAKAWSALQKNSETAKPYSEELFSGSYPVF